MGADDSPAYHRRTLGRRLRRLRQSAGFAFREAGERLELSETTFHRIERGKTKVDIHAVKSMLDLYGVGADEWEPILDLVREANKKGWWAKFGLTNKDYPALETAASAVWAFCFGYLHGLLQTEGYMKAILHLMPRTEKQLANQMAIRKIRQERLTDEQDPLELIAVIEESALRRPVGGRDVMRAQLLHLLDMAEVNTVTIQVLPTEVGAHLGLYGSFSVLQFPDPEEPDVAYYDHIVGPTFVTRAAGVECCRLTIKHLRSLALSSEDSKALIRRIIDEL